MNNETSAKIYVIETTRVSSIIGDRVAKNAGAKNEGNLHYVIENKWRKNVRNRSFHYITENTQVVLAFPLC
jgi:hypothetical protein